jgi:drug/metabolite transporter (DMT)-like permease
MPPTHATSILRGLLLVILAGMCFALLDANAKWLGQSYPVTQVVWMRYAIGAIIAVLYAARALRWTMFATRHPWLQASRGALLLICTASNFIALNYLPMALVLAVIFTAPLMTCALSVPLLGEKVGWRRWSAIGVGFLGVLVIVRPGFGEVHWAIFLALGSAFFGALYNIVTRQVARHDDTRVSLVYVSLVGALIASPGLAVAWVTPVGWDWALFVGLGASGALGHFLLIGAFKHAPASTLAPFSYVQIVWSTLMGYLVFRNLPDLYTFLGAAIIIASGVYLVYRERRLGRGITAKAERPA